MDKLFSKINYRLIDESLVSDTNQLTEIDHVCDLTDTQTAVCTILEQQKAGNYVLVITDSSEICNLLLAFNPTFKDHKISVLCNDVLYADDAAAEIERLEKMLYTKSGIEYFPSKEIGDRLFESDNGQLLVNCVDAYINSDEEDRLLYTSDKKPWGYILAYTKESLIGKLCDNIHAMTLAERTMTAAAVLNCFKEERLSDSVFLFKTENGITIRSVGTPDIRSSKQLFVLIYEIYFGHTPLKDRMRSLIEDRMEHPEYPCILFELFELAFAEKIYPGIPCKASALDLLEDILHYMTIFIVKEDQQ